MRVSWGGFEFISNVCVERVEDGTAYVGACVIIMFMTGMGGGDGEDFFARVRNLDTIGVVFVLNETSWKFGDGQRSDVPVEALSVDQGVHCRG